MDDSASDRARQDIPTFEQLEQRVLLSADPLGLAANAPYGDEGLAVPAIVIEFEFDHRESAGDQSQSVSPDEPTTVAESGVVFTAERPAEGSEYSTVFVGGDDSGFAEYGTGKPAVVTDPANIVSLVDIFFQDFESGLGPNETLFGGFTINDTNAPLNNGTLMMGHPATYGNNQYDYYEIRLDLTDFSNVQLQFDYAGHIVGRFNGFNVQASTSPISAPADLIAPLSGLSYNPLNSVLRLAPEIGTTGYDSGGVLDSGIAVFDLSAFDDQVVDIRLQFGSGIFLTNPGINIDNLRVRADAPEPSSAEVHGQQWNDLDGDGVRDAGEPGLNGWVIELFDDQGTLAATQTSADMDLDGNGTIDPATERGLYGFTGLAAGTYTVGEVLQPGWEQTSPGSVAGNTILITGLNFPFLLSVAGDAGDGVKFVMNDVDAAVPHDHHDSHLGSTTVDPILSGESRRVIGPHHADAGHAGPPDTHFFTETGDSHHFAWLDRDTSTPNVIDIWYDFRAVGAFANMITPGQRALVVDALDQWEAATLGRIDFVRNTGAPSRDIINIGTGDLAALGNFTSGPGEILGLGGGTYTHSADHTITGGISWQDFAETWDETIGNGNPAGTFDYFTVAAQEIGHALGLGHANDLPGPDVMDGSYIGEFAPPYSANDEAHIRSVYGIGTGGGPTVSLSLSGSPMAEAGGEATVTATLSATSTQIVTVDLGFTGTATGGGTDYNASAAQIVIPVGGTTGSITLTAVQDTLGEPDETIIVDITSVTNGTESGTQQATATITDDDGGVPGVWAVVLGPGETATGIDFGNHNLNEAPTITSTASVNVPENQTAVIDVQSTDPEGETEGFGLSYRLTGSVDDALFAIDAGTGVLTLNSAPDFESPGDVGGNNVYDVEVTVIDSGGLTDVQNLRITVTDANDAPVVTSNGGGPTAAVNAATNQTAVTTVTATDADLPAQTLTFSITGGADQSLFGIVAGTGVLTFNAAPDFENPTDADADNVYDVQVTVTDNGAPNLSDMQDIAVTVIDVNEAPVITSDGGGVAAVVNADENQTAATTVTATDADFPAQVLTFSLTGGADQALFGIVAGTGVLTFNSAPDFENPADAGGNNVYDVQVTVTDNGGPNLSDVQDIAVTVIDVNEAPTVALQNTTTTLAEDADTSSAVKVADIVVTDDGLGTNTLSLTGADVELFEIVGGELRLQAGAVLDFATNPILDVTVEVNDSTLGSSPDDTASLVISITDASTPDADIFFQDFESGLGPNEILFGGFTINDTNAPLNNGTLMMGHPTTYGNNQYDYYEVRLDLTDFSNVQLQFDYAGHIVGRFNGFNVQASTSPISPPADLIAPLSGLPYSPLISILRLAREIGTTGYDSGGVLDSGIAVFDLSAFDDQVVNIRLQFGSGIFFTNPGINIDNLRVRALQVSVTDVNEARTAALPNTTRTPAEDAGTPSAVEVADIVATDDGLGTNTLSLSGADAGQFEIGASELRLQAGAVLDLTTTPILDATVEVDDSVRGVTPDDMAALSMTVTAAAFERGSDFGTSSSRLEPTFVSVTGRTLYSAAQGYGWLSGTIFNADRGTDTAPTRDFNDTTLGTFVADLPNGTYDVAVTLGDTGVYQYDQQGIVLEGLQVASVSTVTGEVVTNTYEVTLSDGQLTLLLGDLGGSDPNVLIEALAIAAAGPSVVSASPTGDRTGSVDRTTLTTGIGNGLPPRSGG